MERVSDSKQCHCCCHIIFYLGRFCCVDVSNWSLHDIVSSAFILDLVYSDKVRVVLVLTGTTER